MKKFLLASLIAAVAAPSFASDVFIGGQIARSASDYKVGWISGVPDDSLMTQFRFGSYFGQQHRITGTLEWSGADTDEFGMIAHYDYMIPLNAQWSANVGAHLGMRWIEMYDDYYNRIDYDFSALQYGIQFGAVYHMAPQLDFGINMRLSSYDGSQTVDFVKLEKENDATFGLSIDYRF
ncbi:outer membrane beta-barrel protein [Thaumasiovibrio subtropicus]|uniref:outer membrane beta-barrel protein n=1 Tax=Thaumasiovibrio subtropicus TaxID=1891207 RepID=UPI000B357001|nr:outer membrane beta-barrel protein [Thaumasiovibrio subtropicus]